MLQSPVFAAMLQSDRTGLGPSATSGRDSAPSTLRWLTRPDTGRTRAGPCRLAGKSRSCQLDGKTDRWATSFQPGRTLHLRPVEEVQEVGRVRGRRSRGPWPFVLMSLSKVGILLFVNGLGRDVVGAPERNDVGWFYVQSVDRPEDLGRVPTRAQWTELKAFPCRSQCCGRRQLDRLGRYRKGGERAPTRDPRFFSH